MSESRIPRRPGGITVPAATAVALTRISAFAATPPLPAPAAFAPESESA